MRAWARVTQLNSDERLMQSATIGVRHAGPDGLTDQAGIGQALETFKILQSSNPLKLYG